MERGREVDRKIGGDVIASDMRKVRISEEGVGDRNK